MKAGAKLIEESDLSLSFYMPAGLAWVERSEVVRESRACIYVQTSEVHSDWSSTSV
jgi:hypothetical protein